MYKCMKCKNIKNFEEQNVIKTHVKQNKEGNIISTLDEFFYLEDVVCLECGATRNDEDIVSYGEKY